MKARIGWYTLGAAIFSFGLGAGGSACRADGTTSTATAAGPGGTGTGGGGTTTGVNVGGGTGTTTSTGAAGGGTGGSTGCDGQIATVQDVNTDAVGPGVDVKLEGVVAMSRKIFVNHSKSSGSCLWGVFVSAPGLTETGPNTGLVIKSYGTDAVIPPGGTEAACPKLGEPAGDAIPDDVQPGDVLTIIGETSTFPTASLMEQYCTNPGDTTIPGREVAFVCSAVKTGTAPVPAPHVATPEEMDKLMDPSDDAFHAQWTGVRLRLPNVTPANDPIVGMYGIITLSEGNVEVGNELYFTGVMAPDICERGPLYVTNPPSTFNRIDGFSYLNFCRWSFQPLDKCADFDPFSDDCTSATDCQ